MDLALDVRFIKRNIIGFIKREVKRAGFKKIIVGLSGGLDSSLCAFLAVEALGRKNVIGAILPYKITNKENIKDARAVIKTLKIKSITIDITSWIDSYFRKFPKASRLRRGNRMARERMSILYDLSKAYNALVLGTGNKTEWLLGYFTLHGDVACDINPIGGLYKTQVRLLAKAIGVPEKIIKKVPSADLWPGQTDESELGITYKEVDRLLYYMVDKGYSTGKLRSLGFKKNFIQKVFKRIKKYAYKRRGPLVLREGKTL